MNWFAPWLAAFVLFYTPVHAKVTGSADGCEEALAAHIANSRARVTKNQFITGRDFGDYEDMLGARGLPGLSSMIDALPKGALWLDLGAGQALAQRDFAYKHEGGKGLRLVSLSFDAPEDEMLATDIEEFSAFFRFIETGFLEDAMANPAHPVNELRGQVDFLTEVWGPTSYMRDVNQAYEIIADLLKVGGRARILMGNQTRYFRRGRNVTAEQGAHEICLAGGQRLKLVAFGARYNVHSVGIFEKVSDVKGPCSSFNLSEFVDDGPPVRFYSVP